MKSGNVFVWKIPRVISASGTKSTWAGKRAVVAKTWLVEHTKGWNVIGGRVGWGWGETRGEIGWGLRVWGRKGGKGGERAFTWMKDWRLGDCYLTLLFPRSSIHVTPWIEGFVRPFWVRLIIRVFIVCNPPWVRGCRWCDEWLIDCKEIWREWG